ncbi:MAG: transcriptional regulator [Verrucomicrobia bacterium]|jgi:LacI family transcriptional regulator|nr:transcriptional regulator [Verrucomicrobiota bacterium]
MHCWLASGIGNDMLLVKSFDQSFMKAVSSIHAALPLPERVSLVTQTARILREGLAGGRWPGALPGERLLAEQLRVSRPTLRAALAQLEKEGLLQTSHGKRRQALTVHGKRKVSPGVPKSICLLSPHPLDEVPPMVLFWINELRVRLAELGQGMELVVRPSAYHARAERTWEELVQSHPSAAWVLFLSTEPMQRWFAKHKIPALVVGSCPPDDPLPSVDVDYRAACRHAAQWFSGHGHKRLALLLPSSGCPGDQESEDGFREGAVKGEVKIVRHDASVTGVCAKVDRLLALAEAPTAFLIARSAHALTVLTHLQRRGLKVPQDVVLISRDEDPYLQHVVPTLARYTSRPQQFARKVGEALVQVLERGVKPVRPVRLMPEFLRGETAR